MTLIPLPGLTGLIEQWGQLEATTGAALWAQAVPLTLALGHPAPPAPDAQAT